MRVNEPRRARRKLKLKVVLAMIVGLDLAVGALIFITVLLLRLFGV